MVEFLAIYADKLDVWLPRLLLAAVATLRLTAITFVVACVIGLFFALLRTAKSLILRRIATVYIEVVRGLPALVILFLLYFGLGDLGIPWLVMNTFTAAVIGLGMQGGALLAEVFRSGIEALHRGQTEAALSIGMTPAQVTVHIILPQAIRIVLPPVANYLIGLLKETSICSIIATPELMLRAKDLASASFRPMHVFLLAGVLYFVMSYPLSLAVRYLDARLAEGR
jgi:His/Glu/Gln/Arg/opine family amino acid ABC transporter permease subunit